MENGGKRDCNLKVQMSKFCSWDDISPSVQNACLAMTLPDGSMAEDALDADWLVVLQQGRKTVAWAIVIHGVISGEHVSVIELFVPTIYRRKGLASILVEEARQDFDELHGFAHDKESRRFFLKLGVNVV